MYNFSWLSALSGNYSEKLENLNTSEQSFKNSSKISLVLRNDQFDQEQYSEQKLYNGKIQELLP